MQKVIAWISTVAAIYLIVGIAQFKYNPNFKLIEYMGNSTSSVIIALSTIAVFQKEIFD